MKKFHTYTRIILILVTLVATVATRAQGQDVNEAIIPMQNVTTWEQHSVDGHPINNLKDGEENTTWSSYRDAFAVLEYMHVKNPDASKNGRRHWVELPYIPNQNTEIEITFKAKTTSGEITQNIFGCGYPRWGTGMSLNINGDGKIVFSTSNHTHTLNVQADNDKHTVICSATSVTIDGGENLMPGTVAPDDGSTDVIQDGYTSQHNLCLFSNPGEDQDWARCFDGDIYNVKIRENGKLLYDLVPAKGWWGRPGFYDSVSTNVYTFFDMVDYVKNDIVTADDPALHIHYKIPYKMGTGTTPRTQWTDNLVTNGNFATNDTASYTFWKDIFVPRVSEDGNGKFIQVYNNGTHPEGNVWDCHLTINLTAELEADEIYELSFYAKASKNVVATFDFSNAAGDWHSGEGVITSSIKNIPFTTGWERQTYTIQGREVENKGLIKGIGLNLNNEKSAVLYQVAAFELKKQGEDDNLVAPHNEYTDLSGYPINDAISAAGWTSRIITNEEKKCVQVVNNGTGANSWDCQFRMNLSETLTEGDQYSISFLIKAQNAATIGAQLQQAGGGYYGNLPQVQVGTTWQRVEWTGKVGARDDGSVNAIGLLLNETKSSNTYYITDIVIKKGTPSTEMVPDTELEVTYKNTRTDRDYTSSRYLFSYGTKEANVLALSIKEDGYNYTTGGATTNFGTVPNVKNQTITTTFRPTELIRGSVYNVTSATTWNTPVNYLYLFGTHSTTDDMYARSFVGEIYGAVIREGGQVKVELQPAWKNGVYGFYDRRTNTFYTKDEDDDKLCGKGANFRGVTGHDAQAPIDHAEGIPQVGSVYPYTLTIDLASPKVVKNFYMTTAADKIGDYTNNSPARWTLYGSSGDGNWTELYKYEQVVPKFSTLNAGTTTPSTSTPYYKSASELESATTYYLYNVETGRFLLGSGGSGAPEWNTRAYVLPDRAWKVKVTLEDGKYTIYDCNLTKEPGGSRWYELYAFDNTNVWTDYDNQSGTFSRTWNIKSIGNNQYELSCDDLIPNAKLGTSVSSDIGSDQRLYLSTDAKNTTWAFVSEEDYNAYQAAKNLQRGDPMLNGKQYKYAINAENAEYKQFRLVIDRLVANNNQINLAELAFTSYFDFEHYVGRVYDNMGTPPDNLAVGGSSGYQQEYKNSNDDSRLGSGVTILTIQRTHEYEHEIYLLPGETVDLTPFSDFGSAEWRSFNYQEQYVRWYDYKTDQYSDKLTFDKRDGRTVSRLTKGDFAWNLRDDKRRTREGSLAHYTAADVTSPDENHVIDVIAIEAGGIFDWNEAVWDDTKNAYTVTEPTLLWRHTFVIKDAKQRSDEMFASAAENAQYLKDHKIKLMCPAGTPFQYPLPCMEYVGTGAPRPTNYFYLKDDVYTPVYHYTIDTYRINADGTETQLGSRNHSYSNVMVSGSLDQLAYPYKALEDYNRVLYIKDPQVGKYRIVLNALGSTFEGGIRDQRVGESVPVRIMQYELEVLPPADGIMVNETELKSRDDLSHQIPANMDKAFGKPTTKVDFDEVLPSQTTDAGNGHAYLKWPWRWEDSSYGFGYENRGDYNMYMVADHMSITPFHGRGNDDAADKLTYNDVYDRKYYDNGSDPNKKGYFFYANAASDPSRMSVLNIGRNFCANTKVFVSAWVCEFQGQNEYAETANVIFSFRGVKKDGTETVLNSFVTGYVSGGWNTPTGYFPKTTVKDAENKDVVQINHVNPTTNPDNRGKWMHVYYTFKTDESVNFSDFDHYIITLENNCTSSEGADYAIDDIRCYVRKPQVDAKQLKPVCNGDPATDLKIYADFDQMMDVFGFQEENGTKDLYYCFLDREVYETELEKAYNEGVSAGTINSTTYPTLTDWREKVDKADASNPFRKAYEDAFWAALVKNSYGTGKENYGTLTFNKRYNDNEEYSDVDNFSSYFQALRQKLGATRNLIFPCHATDAQMKVGKKYVIALINGTNYNSEKTIPVNFRLEDQCQSSSDFTVVFSGEVKIDGVLQADQEGKSYCKNQKPVVTIDLNGIDSGGEVLKTEQAYFDWYFGPSLLNAEEQSEGWTTAYAMERQDELWLRDAMGYLRDEYPTATQEDVMKDGSTITATGSLTADMLAYIRQMVTDGKLALYMKSEILSTTELYNKEMGHTKFYITAIPIRPEDMEDDVKFCLEPFKVSINLDQNTPSMKDGADQGVDYPSDMNDVPLRIGLKQLKRTVITDLNASSATQKLWLPLRAVTPTTNGTALGVHKLIGIAGDAELGKSADDLIYLAASTDPAVLAGTSGAVDIEDYSATYGSIISDLKVIGKVMNIQADKSTTGSVAQLAFIEDFKFREGYEYTLKFHFEEDYSEIAGDHPAACPGEVVFTIKVVPEYQMWTGAVSRNWNDDRNWKRVTENELLWTDAKDDDFLTANADYTTDGGTNDNAGSYAPADFTKVIIPADAPRVPFMYNMRESINTASVQFAGAPQASYQIFSTRPAADVYDEILESEAYERQYLDLNGKMFVITDVTGMNTLGVTHETTVHSGNDWDAFVVTNNVYAADMHVYAKFARVMKTGIDGNVYTIQLCKADGTNFEKWGNQGYLNFQPAGQNTVFALGLGEGQKYGQDGENLALWRVSVVGDGEVTVQNVGNGGYLNPSIAAPSAGPVVCHLAKSFTTAGAGEIYHQTSLVQYEMASVNRTDKDVACRSWYDHTCDQIHFNAGAVMMDQRYLYYNKAWCDIDVIPGTWQTVASPLMNIVAGDLYLPTATARQQTPLFEDITYQTELNDRFKPAVFQHSWNKSMAKVYKLDGGMDNVGIKLDWSHVYNDVNVKYGAGQGFSIKVDVSAMPEADQPGKGSNPATARFRFPKADTQYTYYNPGNEDGDKKTENVNNADIVNGVRPGRLSDLSSGSFQQMVGDDNNGATPTDYFLVGNPLICWLDMQKFFEQNTQFEPKYWIATDDGQRTALFTEEGFLSTSTEDPKFLPPGISFFVQKKQTATAGGSSTVTPVFDNTMMSYTQAEPRTNGNDNPRNIKTRSNSASMPQLSLTATTQNGRQSMALLTDGTWVQHDGVETLFDSNLKDDALLYTTRNGQAMTISSVAPGDTVPLIISGAQSELLLHLEGASDFSFPLYLIDSEEGTIEPLDGDMKLRQTTNGVRYYIASPHDQEAEDMQANMPHVTAGQGKITVYAPVGEEITLSQIYKTDGTCMDEARDISGSHATTLRRGIYIVKLLVGEKTYTYKLLLAD